MHIFQICDYVTHRKINVNPTNYMNDTIIRIPYHTKNAKEVFPNLIPLPIKDKISGKHVDQTDVSECPQSQYIGSNRIGVKCYS